MNYYYRPRFEPIVLAKLPGRNDICHCGSGKKYKNCHYQSDKASRFQRQDADVINEVE